MSFLWQSGDTTYACEARFVREVRRTLTVARVPGAHPTLAGVAFVDGQVLPLVTLADDAHGHYIIINHPSQSFAVRARHVIGLSGAAASSLDIISLANRLGAQV